MSQSPNHSDYRAIAKPVLRSGFSFALSTVSEGITGYRVRRTHRGKRNRILNLFKYLRQGKELRQCLLRAIAPEFGPAERMAAVRELAELGDLETARRILFDFQRETGLTPATRKHIATGLKLLSADEPNKPEDDESN